MVINRLFYEVSLQGFGKEVKQKFNKSVTIIFLNTLK